MKGTINQYLFACCDDADRRMAEEEDKLRKLKAKCKCPPSQRSAGHWDRSDSFSSDWVTRCLRCGKIHNE